MAGFLNLSKKKDQYIEDEAGDYLSITEADSRGVEDKILEVR